MSKKHTKNARRLTATIVTAGVVTVAGAGVAVALAVPGDDAPSPTVTAVAAQTTAPTIRYASSPERRQQAIDQLAFLGQPAGPGDLPPKTSIPESSSKFPSDLDRDRDLPFARKVPGLPATWLVPLLTGGYGLVRETSGGVAAPGQLEAGQLVSVKIQDDESLLLTGIFADGVSAVSVKSADGKTETVKVSGNAISKIYAATTPKEQRPVSVSIEANDNVKAGEASPLAGVLADGTLMR